MTRARTLSRLANSNVLAVDSSNNVGINSTIPDAKLDVIGIVSATSFSGNLTGDASGSSGSCSGNAATATLATNASGLSGSPDITINNLVGVAATFSGICTAVSFKGDGSGLSGVGGDTDITSCLFI